MTGEAHHRINWTSATITIDGATGLQRWDEALQEFTEWLDPPPQTYRLVVGPLADEWRARVFDNNGALLFNEVAFSSTKGRGVATVTFADGTTWSVEREGDCGCGN